MKGWTSVNSPPEPYKLVQFKSEKGIRYIGYYTGTVWWDCFTDMYITQVTHWRFVPWIFGETVKVFREEHTD